MTPPRPGSVRRPPAPAARRPAIALARRRALPSSINFAKLNHILLPGDKAGRDRFRRGIFGKLFSPLAWFYEALSEEGRVLVAVSMLVGFFGIDVQVSEVYLLWAAIIGLFVASFAVRPAYRLPEVDITVVTPRRVTVGDELRFQIVLRNRGIRDALSVRVRGPFLPWDGRWSGKPPTVRLVRAGTEETAELGARFVARGEHHLDPFGACALVPLGLCAGRPIWSGGVKLLVVPKIAPVVRLSMPIGRRHQPGGVALASKTGESMDLLGVRPYRPGDPVKHLHAKSWARARIPVVREYQEEYFSRVGVIVDTTPTDERRLEASISLAAGVIAHLSRGEALIDLLVVGGELHDLTIGRHLGFLEQALDLLACVEPARDPVTADELIARLAPHLSRLSCVIVVTATHDAELAERIRGHGVGCTTLVIAHQDRPGAAPVDGPNTRIVTPAAIERGEALSL